MKIKAGIIGCGNISKYHFDAIEENGHLITHVCDIDEQKGKRTAQHRNATYIKDWRELLDVPEIDVVHVTLPSRFHKEICIQALRKNKHVICEKTLSESPEDSLEIIETAKQLKKSLFTSYMKRHLPAVTQAKNQLSQIGQIISARFFTRQPWGNLWDGEPENEYFRKPKGSSSKVRSTYGGGILHCGGSHILDLICFLIGKPDTVSAHMTIPEYLDYDICTTAVLEIGSVPVYFEALAHPLSHTGLLADGWDEGFEILGTKGKIIFQSSLWDDVKSKTPILIFEEDSMGIKKEFRYSPVSPFSLAIKEFYRNIASGVQKCQPISSGYNVDQIISSIIKSSQERKRLDIPWK